MLLCIHAKTKSQTLSQTDPRLLRHAPAIRPTRCLHTKARSAILLPFYWIPVQNNSTPRSFRNMGCTRQRETGSSLMAQSLTNTDSPSRIGKRKILMTTSSKPSKPNAMLVIHSTIPFSKHRSVPSYIKTDR